MRLFSVALVAVALASGCLDDCYDCFDEPSRTGPAAAWQPGGPAPSYDTDLDGIRDAHERRLANHCEIHGVPCRELGVTPPSVGVRDLIVVQYGRSGDDQDWRLTPWVWDEFLASMADRNITAQVADLGVADDLDVPATWDDPDNAGRYWAWFVGFDAETPETAGWNEWNLIMIHRQDGADDPEGEYLMTLLHEVYHGLLGDLEGDHTACDDDEWGGPGHSNDPHSVLYVSPDCESQPHLHRIDPSAAEDLELATTPFENLAMMNSDDWWEYE